MDLCRVRRMWKDRKTIVIVFVLCAGLFFLTKWNFFGKAAREGVAEVVVVSPLSNKILNKFDFKKQNKQPKRTIPLVFVDEHHEVVPYWTREIVKGKLKNKGNILVHVDGHSDLATPSNFELISRTKVTTDVTKLGPFMQSNDRFIVPFLLNGIFDGVLWVYPTFSAPINNTITNMVQAFGFTNKGIPCLCNDMKKTSKTICIETDDDRSVEDKEKYISADACKLVKKIWLRFILDVFSIFVPLFLILFKGFVSDYFTLNMNNQL